ncbi:MAG: PAS domain-containing protein [Campylobacteraceae bacterium]|nr:PAS domain-containing protein [Campylobacteraceae bacterium]
MQKPKSNKNENILNSNNFIVSKTDIHGKIIYGNKVFIEISGYEESELLGQPHSLLRHPDMPKIIFSLLWERIKNKGEIFAYVKNLCKDGSYYWVFANVTATLDKNSNIRDFHSVRRKPSNVAMNTILELYEQLLLSEKKGGLESSKRLLNNILDEKGGISYDEFVLGLQQ